MKYYLYIILFSLNIVLAAQEPEKDIASIQYIPLSLTGTDFSPLKDSTENFYVLNNRLIKSDVILYPSLPIKQSPFKKESFLKSDWIYFIGAAALAAVIYFLLPEDKANVEKNHTFGTPPTPR